MTAILISPPASEPVSLDEAKTFLRVEDEDALVTALVAAARRYVEAATGRVLITQGWRILRDAWPHRRVVRLAPAPVISVDAITVRAADGVVVVDPADYVLDAASAPARLVVSDAAAVPAEEVNGIEIDVTAGYGAAGDVPEPLRLAIRRLAAHWYEDREAEAAGAPGVAALLAPYRLIGLGL